MGTPSAGLLHPPEVTILSLLVDVQEAPELVVHARTEPPLEDSLQCVWVPHRVRLRPGEQVVSQAPKKVDHGDQEHAGVSTRATGLTTGVTGSSREEGAVVSKITGLATREARGGGSS